MCVPVTFIQERHHMKYSINRSQICFGSPLHVKIRWSTQHSPNPHTLLGTVVGFQGCLTSTITLVIPGEFNIQHMQLLMNWVYTSSTWSITISSFCLGTTLLPLVNWIILNFELEPAHSPRLPDDHILIKVSDILPDESHGIILQYHSNYNHCEIVGFQPLGAWNIQQDTEPRPTYPYSGYQRHRRPYWGRYSKHSWWLC